MATMIQPASQADDLDAGIEASPGFWKSAFDDNKGAVLILLSCVTGSSMDAIGRFLQQGENGMHSFQVIVARMGITFLLSSTYMYMKRVPDFPLGNPEVRLWLVLRAVCGFFGLFCLYYSVHYLPLAEATVFRFLVPIMTALACSIFLGERFTRKELIAGLLALLGVVIIAQPASIFGKSQDNSDINMTDKIDDVSPHQRLLAIAVATVGIFGASGAYTMIRVIGHRAHALMSVNYFAVLSTITSSAALLIIPGIGFTMPQGARQWILLILMGVLGFILQFLLTAGLQLDRSSKATSMMYSQIIFALMFDFAIWGVLPGMWSLIGGAIVVASTLWAALQKKTPDASAKSNLVSEESALLGDDRSADGQVLRRRASIGV